MMLRRLSKRILCGVVRPLLAAAAFFPFLALQAQILPPDSAKPVISLWSGSDLTFGIQGVPQPFFNILGNASALHGVASLRYTLNGGTSLPLSLGPDTRRLARAGDFNIDLTAASLAKWPQVNTVAITATDSLGNASTVNVRVTNHTPSYWPRPYEVLWSGPMALRDSAQIVDGRWAWMSGGIVSDEPGYDRLVAIGDTGWTDYEVTAEVTVLEVIHSDTAYDVINGGPGVGLILHWNGHTNDPVFIPPITQPRSGYLPFGAIGYYHWRRGGPSRWEIMGNNIQVLAQDTTSQEMQIGVRYLFKMRVTTLPGGDQSYFLKYWKAVVQEPTEWLLVASQDSTNPQHGSLLLMAHHVKAVFGKVRVEPLGSEILVTDIQSLAGPNSAYVTWETNAKSSGRVLYGSDLASPDTSRDALVSTVHQVLLPDLASSTRYQIRVEAATADGSAIPPRLSSFTTTNNRPRLAFESDSFNTAVIDTTRWVFINPDPPSTLSLVQNTGVQALSIAVPGGSGHDVWEENKAPRIMQTASNMDFQAEAKFLSLPDLEYQLEGILVEQDVDDYIRFDFVSDAAGLNAFTATFQGGEPTVRGKVQVAARTPLFLRVTRAGNLWKSFFSYDSINWSLSSTFTSAMRMNGIGLVAGNAPSSGSDAPAFTGIIDHFINLVEKANDVPLSPAEAPLSFALEQNYPNPFNPLTIIKYTIAGTGDLGLGARNTRLVVYDLLGRQVDTLVDEVKAPGSYEVTFDGSGLASGVYMYRMTAGAFSQSRMMVLLK